MFLIRRRRAATGCLLVLACASAFVKAQAPPKRPPRTIVLITLDTTRADHLGCAGWAFAHTPNLDALAKRGARFMRCDTAAPITLPSHATILTGLNPPRHGVRDNGTFTLPENVETVATRLRSAGYDTGAIVSSVVLARRYGLDRGFRLYDDDLGAVDANGSKEGERRADATTAAALAMAAQLRAPYFLWVHYFDPHEDYRPPARIVKSIRGPNRLYDGEIAFVDEQLGILLAKLPKDSDVVIVGDHGEMLGEHGELTHGLLPYAGARRVPLILAGPDVPAGRTTSCLVRTADVAPTVLLWAGVAAAAALDGTALLPLPVEPACDRESYTESFLPFFAYKWYPLRSISDGRSFYLHAPAPSLYAISDDPGEQHDLAAKQPRAAALWETRFQKAIAAMGDALDRELEPSDTLSGEEREKLKSLGYVGGGSGGHVGETLPDPRAMTAIAAQLHHATQLAQEGNLTEALGESEKVAKADPHNFPALMLQGECLRDTGQYEKALTVFRGAARENPRSVIPVANIAGALYKLGRKDEAVPEFRRALALDPAQAESAAGFARWQRESGDRKGALEVLDRAIAAGCHAPMVLLERGVTLAELGRLDDALLSFREAAGRDPQNPVPLEDAARAAYQLERYTESAQLYERVLQLAPGRGDVWKTVGAIYVYQLDDRRNGRRAFREALRLENDVAERADLEAVLRDLGPAE